MNRKITKLREKMKSESMDGFIVYNPANIKYLIGLDAEGMLAINKFENTFITDSRYIEDARNMITINDEIIIQDIKQLSEEELLNFFSGCDKVGFEENYVTYANYRNMLLKFRIKDAVESNNMIEKLREIKDEQEIEYIETACNITDNCFLHIRDFIKVGMTEKEVAFEIYKFFLTNGADGLAFDTIVASGANTSKPHAIPTDKKIEYGDPILIDFGAKYRGYCADMTRTIFVGEISKRHENLYKIVLDTQNRAMAKMKADADTKEIQQYVINEFSCNNFDLIHALGHGVGIDIHEKPFFSTKYSSFLQPNMVITNEPGIYIPGEIGIRIEDTLLVNNLEPTVLTKSNKNIVIING